MSLCDAQLRHTAGKGDFSACRLPEALFIGETVSKTLSFKVVKGAP
jgi:hypothetical protein